MGDDQGGGPFVYFCNRAGHHGGICHGAWWTLLWAHTVLGDDLCSACDARGDYGLSLLLLFIGIGLDRGVMTIVLAHTTFSMCYVSVVVSSRLITFDRSLEEAALDLAVQRARRFDWLRCRSLHPL